MQADSTSGFSLHAQLAADCAVIADAPLSRLLLMNDAQYPWFILVPRIAGLREIYELDTAGQQLLLAESVALGRAAMQAYGGDKLNVAALGNMVPQLHLHHIVRHHGDAAWPAPVWGRHPAVPYTPEQRSERLAKLGPLLGADWRWL
ncbi:MAG: histidine triad protein [Hydrocarboniphaga sp.]|uniref:HIT domain-containing protein n=1 Tax=Hydrocarboniphaga sp. TaxID=2033016 RepID=UPI002605D9D4|nr:HIT family protein [Hydrocarboniphaga sp.]MDB5972129.1 histidine triad protein [Hydrocarboniphaga sp.]